MLLLLMARSIAATSAAVVLLLLLVGIGIHCALLPLFLAARTGTFNMLTTPTVFSLCFSWLSRGRPRPLLLLLVCHGRSSEMRRRCISSAVTRQLVAADHTASRAADLLTQRLWTSSLALQAPRIRSVQAWARAYDTIDRDRSFTRLGNSSRAVDADAALDDLALNQIGDQCSTRSTRVLQPVLPSAPLGSIDALQTTIIYITVWNKKEEASKGGAGTAPEFLKREFARQAMNAKRRPVSRTASFFGVSIGSTSCGTRLLDVYILLI